MSDSLRKPFSDCVFEKMTPDSSKSTIDKAKENITTTADRKLPLFIHLPILHHR